MFIDKVLHEPVHGVGKKPDSTHVCIEEALELVHEPPEHSQLGQGHRKKFEQRKTLILVEGVAKFVGHLLGVM